MTAGPLRRALIVRAAHHSCPEHERDRIIRCHFTRLDPDWLADQITQIASVWGSSRRRAEDLIAQIIQVDEETRSS